MSYLPYSSVGILPTTTRITIPAPISTGVSLSDRFRRLPTAHGNVDMTPGGREHYFGVGIPQKIPAPSSYLAPVDNRAFAMALAKRAQIQAVRLKRKTISVPQRGRGGRVQPVNIPVTARLGVVRVSHPLAANRNSSIRGARRGRGGGRGGLNFVQRGGGIVAKKVVGTTKGVRGGPGRFQRGTLANANRGNRGTSGPWKAEVKSKEDLDKELDSYMSKSKTRLRSNLDKELDDYMLEARAQAEAVVNTVLSVDANTSDVVMTEA